MQSGTSGINRLHLHSPAKELRDLFEPMSEEGAK